MYVTTFYSFKGGVGRTMSLVNVGLELIKKGHKVLMVDFDLEAPGIETFNLPKPEGGSKGLVDYVTQYREDGQSPDVRDFLYESEGLSNNGGKLWIMPSGMHDENYAKRLNQIKWDDIYNNEDGYLMIEDMKAQWKEYLNPDYVLIDSRTGHTDVGGICTRQLPDAVVVLFFPNEQNLIGLEKVVPTIRAESETERRKRIQIHFVSSNVPNLDDEKQILEKRVDGFKKHLKYEKLACTIHHYNHLALLDQEVFTDTHPRSQLAREYRELYAEIVKHNPEDRDGVLSFLKDIISKPRHGFNGLTATELETRLVKICLEHSSDGEILSKVAMFRHRSGKERDAFDLLNQSISVGYETPDLLLMRASLGYSMGHKDVQGDIEKVLLSKDVGYFEVKRAVQLLKRIAPFETMMITNSLAFKLLPAESRYEIADDLCDDDVFLPVAKIIVENVLQDENTNDTLIPYVISKLSMIQIALGEFSSAMDRISSSREEVFNLDIGDIFNYSMAEWAENEEPSKDLFLKVLELSEDIAQDDQGPNFLQCMAISYWVVGDMDASYSMVNRAEQQLRSRPGVEFSAWRYLDVSSEDFIDDIKSIRSMIGGAHVSPLFMLKERPLLS